MTVRAAGSPIRYTASTLPTRSTTAIVALIPSAIASATPWLKICCTSETVKNVVALAQLPVQSVPAGAALAPAELTAEPPPEQAVHMAATNMALSPLRTLIFILSRALPALLLQGDTCGNSHIAWSPDQARFGRRDTRDTC